MLGWEGQLNVRVTATSPTKSQSSDVTTGSAKSRSEITYCCHQQNMGWHKASGVEEAKWSCWRNCPFPNCWMILPLSHQHRGEMVQKGTFVTSRPRKPLLSTMGTSAAFKTHTFSPLEAAADAIFSISLSSSWPTEQYFKVFRMFHHKILFHLRSTLWPLQKESAPRDPPCLTGTRNFMGGV